MPDSIAEILNFRAEMPISSVYAKIDTVWDVDNLQGQWGPYTRQGIVLQDDDGSKIRAQLTSQPPIPANAKGQLILLAQGIDSRTNKPTGLKRDEYDDREGQLIRLIRVSGKARVIVAPTSEVLNDVMGYGTPPAQALAQAPYDPAPGPVTQHQAGITPDARPGPGTAQPVPATQPQADPRTQAVQQAPAKPEAKSLEDVVSIYKRIYTEVCNELPGLSVDQWISVATTNFITVGNKSGFRVDPWVIEQPPVAVVQSQAPAQEMGYLTPPPDKSDPSDLPF